MNKLLSIVNRFNIFFQSYAPISRPIHEIVITHSLFKTDFIAMMCHTQNGIKTDFESIQNHGNISVSRLFHVFHISNKLFAWEGLKRNKDS